VRLARRTLLVAFLAGFLTWTITVSIAPWREWTQELGACRGADTIERRESAGGDVRGPTGSNPTSTTVFELRCTYDDGERVELVGNDEATLLGFLVGFLIGFVPAAVLYLARTAIVRSSNSLSGPA
jgi:hypothetical protein